MPFLVYPDMGSKVRFELTSPRATTACSTIKLLTTSVSAEHLIGTLSPCEISIVNLPAEFEPLTVA